MLQKQDEGMVLLDQVCNHLGLQERQLFSLQIRESSTAIASITANTHSPRWLEPEKPLKKQIKGLVSPFYLNFRVRFFISDPNSLQCEQTRHLYFLQIRSDIREGRLQCPLSAAVVLASYAVQSEIGDHCPSLLPGYLSKCHFIPEQDEDFLCKVEDLHPQHKVLKQSEAELCFLNTARTLELYGVEIHAAMDINNAPLMVGLTSSGVAIFCNMICSSFFPWGNIIKISFKRKRFLIHLKRKHGETQDCEVSLNLPCPKTCKNLWRSCVDHHSFFSNRITRSPKYNNSTVQSYKKLITQHLGLGNTKTESGPVCQRVSGRDGVEPSTSKGGPGDGDLMLICITPDQEGKFGFNVKGGVDQKMPLAISHVKPDSPAGRCEPKLLEGDLVVLINGRDISEHTHDQVVMFIRASRESHSRELALLIRRKGPGRVAPLLQLPPALTLTAQPQEDKPHSPSQSERVTTLEESMRQLERGIQSGTLCFHFENLYRRKPGLSLDCARLPGNMDKNRYKDVLPYDSTRVVLQGQEDYINASHITVNITTKKLFMYISVHGQTLWQFYVQVWVERCMFFCKLYLIEPKLFHMRGEERAVTHLQYVAWPDHGVPDDPSDFLLFVSSVRERRKGEEPLMVHCSAGIGRTGVLITMETALTLLDKGQPVFPLDIVKTLRDQRAMMVQTTCQFQFVCEAILRVYKDKEAGSTAS
ncbi:Tyrosine-protein phosphatase non-receptor type 3 [Channa argus]|uniref:protein-tyrosine-phosphatase n=1 Tax=Channa argus TaxID=215402 RepID=A0A6G1PNM8_CHAAH|nr:Tyrosine-protein phosphatase non-receptor type 3 [Channa argus]